MRLTKALDRHATIPQIAYCKNLRRMHSSLFEVLTRELLAKIVSSTKGQSRVKL